MYKTLLAAVALTALVGASEVSAQSSRTSVIIKTRVTLGGKQAKFPRKRFYLFRGSAEANKDLVDRIKSAPYIPRDCFYCAQKVTPEYMAWLRAGDCESPYCRDVSADDVVKIREFADAYKKGLVTYKNKPEIARKWVTTNMPAAIRDGYYLQKRKAVDSILAGVKPLATVMTDATSLQATFIDIPITGASEKFIVSNIVPFEFGGKSYLWVCEVDLKPAPTTFPIQASDVTKKVKTCDVVVTDLKKCDAGGCTP